jgi:hypothetical protein
MLRCVDFHDSDAKISLVSIAKRKEISEATKIRRSSSIKKICSPRRLIENSLLPIGSQLRSLWMYLHYLSFHANVAEEVLLKQLLPFIVVPLFEVKHRLFD